MNRQLKYTFNPPTDSKRPFLIDTTTGAITLKSLLDYESGITSYTFQVLGHIRLDWNEVTLLSDLRR